MVEVQAYNTAVVTGAAGDIGRAIVARLLQRGIRVAALDLSMEAMPASVCSEGSDPQLSCFVCDVTQSDQVHAVARVIDDTFVQVDSLITSAAVFRRTPALYPSADASRDVIDTNLLGVLHAVEAFGSIMARARSGRIVHIASIAACTGSALAAGYAASKAGVVAAMRSHARELAPYGIVVNALLPGICATAMTAQDQAMIERFIVPRIPLKRLAQPDEVAEVVEFLVTCRTTYLNGAAITMDGGLHVG